MVNRDTLTQYINNLLSVDQFNDYCPNGLQVAGKDTIKTFVTGVTACQALLDEAIRLNADAVLVHHGYFWRGEAPQVQGIKRTRLATLLKADINLLAYHLPLDAHAVHGNNVQLAERLGLSIEGEVPGTGIGGGVNLTLYGQLAETLSAEKFAGHISAVLGRAPLHIGGSERPIQSVAWCTGGAQNFIEQALTQGVDAYISGEISEQTVHIAREGGLHYFAAGHHATERYGVQSLGEHVADAFGITHHFVDIDNPV